MKTTLKKISDSFTGFLNGDAGGAGLEMISNEIIKKNIHFNDFIDKREPKYRKNYSPGNYTDDRADTKAVIKLLCSSDPFNTDNLLKYIFIEIEKDKNEKGEIRQGYGSIKDVVIGKKSLEKMKSEQAGREDPGNAPLMRCLPLAFIEDKIKRNNYCDVIANVTHPHPLARECTKLVVEAIRRVMIHDACQKDLINTLVQKYSGTFCSDLKEINSLGSPDHLSKNEFYLIAGPQPNPYMKSKGKEIHGLNGTCTHTMKSVIYLLKHCTTSFDGYKQSLLMGGDVDSLAAIVTGTLSGRYGLEGLPKYLSKAEGTKEIMGLSKLFYKTIQTKEGIIARDSLL